MVDIRAASANQNARNNITREKPEMGAMFDLHAKAKATERRIGGLRAKSSQYAMALDC